MGVRFFASSAEAGGAGRGGSAFELIFGLSVNHQRSAWVSRLTNAFSKKVENLGHALALHFMYYNFCRIHQSLRVTPAMEAGITNRLWTIEEILKLI